MRIKAKPKVFISYAHEDQQWRKKLRDTITALEFHAQYPADIFDDTSLRGGDHIHEELLSTQLSASDVVIFLVSPNFIRSKYCRETEVPQAIQQWKVKKSKILPVIVERIHGYDTLPYRDIASSPAELKPVCEYTGERVAWEKVYQDLQQLVQDYYQA